MKASANQKIDSELREQLKNLVATLGGFNSASKFLNINIVSLRGYIDGSKSEIRNDIWEYIISPSLNKNLEDLLNQFSFELTKLRKAQRKILKYESEMEYINESYKENMKSFIELPFNIYFKEYSIDFKGKYQYPIIKDLEKLKEKDKNEVSFDKLVRDIDEFKRLYELFRPITITHDDPYHGTVKMMDGIFGVFAQVFEIKYDDRFSKYGDSWINQFYEEKYGFDEVDWDGLICDLKTISASIDEAIADLALDNIEYFKEFHTYCFSNIVLNKINKLFRTEATNQITVDSISPGEIKMENKIVKFGSSRDLKWQMFEMNNENSNKLLR